MSTVSQSIGTDVTFSDAKEGKEPGPSNGSHNPSLEALIGTAMNCVINVNMTGTSSVQTEKSIY